MAHFFSFLAFVLLSAMMSPLAEAKQNEMSYDNNFYIIASSSTYYANFRHSLDAFIFYQNLKARGITDDQILLMVPIDHVCNPRNPFPATLYGNKNYTKSWVCEDIEVDYKAEDITALSLV